MEKDRIPLRGGFHFYQPDGVFKLGMDAVLLAAFARPEEHARVCDLGAGAGAVSLLIASCRPLAKIDGVELDPAACAAFSVNIEENGLAGRVTCLPGDLRSFSGAGYTLALSNPPYIRAGTGRAAKLPAARQDAFCPLPELCATAARILSGGGRFCLCFRPERLGELLETLSKSGLAPKRLCLVHDRPESPACLVLCEAVKGGRPGLRVQPPLFIRQPGPIDIIYEKGEWPL